ncbi:MAG: glycoside hydrolase family 127 protein [Bacteroidota bacterium]|nr:glycoside hydrolase family 127 protein [Bacteroidota bacterium]
MIQSFSKYVSATILGCFFTLVIFIQNAFCQLQPSASDEIQHRITLATNRILYGKAPKMDEKFILADIFPDKNEPRRFDEFNGDISGRYISAMCALPKELRPSLLHTVLNKIILSQNKDGRIGNANLSYEVDSIGSRQMAQLWGNGRMLVALIDYAEAYDNDEKSKNAAIKLGNFLVKIIENCSKQEVRKRLVGLPAYSFICFTQCNEGLVRLAKLTGNIKYAKLAEQVQQVLEPRANQHSHGYMLTLRGAILNYLYFKNSSNLTFAKIRYDSLVNSNDYLITGGVAEIFGPKPAPYGPNDEGCSEADFFALSIQLWQATNDISYLEKAEYCLLNHFFYNQFETGEFGHHTFDGDKGFRLGNQEIKSWWCCTFHGLQQLIMAQNAIITKIDKSIQIQLFLNKEYKDATFECIWHKIPSNNTHFQLTILKNADSNKVTIRKPSWAVSTSLTINGITRTPVETDGYIYLPSNLKSKDVVQILFNHKVKLVTIEKKSYSLDNFPTNVRGALINGPYLMVVDGTAAPDYLSEPMDDNFIIADSTFVPQRSFLFNKPTNGFLYKHQGFSGLNPLLMRPLSCMSLERHTYLNYNFKWARKP